MNTVKELRDELARAKGELAKEARRRAEAEEHIAEMACRAENQDEINNIRKEIISSMEKKLSIQEKLIDLQKDQIGEHARAASIRNALVANLDREAEERNARMADLERRLAKYEEVELSEPIETGGRGAESGTATREPRELT